MSVNAFVNGLDLYKSDESLKIWRVETPDRKGEFLFTFDCRKVFNFFHDYPEKLTDEEIAIFEKEYPELAALKQPRKAR
jgi:hypothetical protein